MNIVYTFLYATYATTVRNLHMINPEDEIILDLSTSCTKEVAVARLLGWLKGPIRSKVIKVTEHGISEDQLPFLQSMEGSLQAQLSELHESARQDFISAAEADATYEELHEKEEAVNQCKSLMHKAHIYTCDIDEELSKGDASALKIDHEATERTSVMHITLRSLDQWKKDKYDISILNENPEPGSAPEDVKGQPATQEKVKGRDSKGNLSKTRADNLFTTFAFLVEAYAKSSRKLVSDEPNNDAVAKHLEKLATNTKTGETLYGQSDEAIKDRIEEAESIKKSKLPQK